MRRLEVPRPVFRVSGDALGCAVETLASYHGPYHLALSTTVPELLVRVDTVCLGYPDGPLLVAHVTRSARGGRQLRTERPDPRTASLKDARGVFLHEHLHVVCELLRDVLDAPVTVDVPEQAVTQIALA